MAEKVFFQDEQVEAEIQVIKATVLAGMKRTRLMSEGQSYERARIGESKAAEGQANDDEALDRLMLHTFTYPDLIAGSPSGTLAVEGKAVAWPPDFETFLGLPAALCSKWEAAVYRLNPHWSGNDEETPEKKVSESSESSTITSA